MSGLKSFVLNIEEIDGTPSVFPYKLKVTNGALTDNGDGTATLDVTTGGITSHGALSGLANDDHTQYLLVDGSRALGGAWDMGSQILTNVNMDSGNIDTAVVNTEWDTAYTHISTDGTSHANVHTSAMPDSSGVNTDHDVRLVAKVQIAEPSTPSPFAGMIWVDTDADGGSVAHDHTFYRQYSFMMGG